MESFLADCTGLDHILEVPDEYWSWPGVCLRNKKLFSLRKQRPFHDYWCPGKITSEKWVQTMTLPRSGLCVWLVENLFQPIRSATQLWVGTCHQHRGSTLISQSSFSWDTSNSITKGLLFSWGNQWWWHKKCCFYRIEIVIPLAIFIFPFCNIIFFQNMTALPSYDLL